MGNSNLEDEVSYNFIYPGVSDKKLTGRNKIIGLTTETDS